jgi:hypothetical protein
MGGLQYLCHVTVRDLVLDTTKVGHSRDFQSCLGDPQTG